jgi:CBS domain-containing protein
MMKTIHLLSLTAEDLMTRGVVAIPREMSLRAAAHRLMQTGVSGAPVVDEQGRCVGVLSRADLVRYLDQGEPSVETEETTDYSSDWQVVESDPVPDTARYMTTNVITARPETRIGELARLMDRERIHRVLITDLVGRVIGIVSSMDILAALAAADAASRA